MDFIGFPRKNMEIKKLYMLVGNIESVINGLLIIIADNRSENILFMRKVINP